MLRYRKLLAVIGASIGAMGVGLSFALITTNLESIHEQFQATITDLQWMINIYGIFIAAFLVTMGRLGDIHGRKRVYFIGNLLFGLAMIGAGLATSPKMIIAFQGLYGVSAAILLPLSQALLVDLFEEDQKSVAIAIYSTALGLTFAVGPLIGGLLLNHFTWRSIFLINVPFAVIGCLLTLFYVKESKSEGQSKALDWWGAFLLMISVGCFVLATVQSNIWSVSWTVFFYGVALIALIALLIVEKRVEMPIIREDLFKSRAFLTCSAGNFVMIAVFWAGIFLIPLYLQKVLLFSPMQAGLMMLVFSAPLGLLSPLTGYLFRHIGPKWLTIMGFILFMISLGLQLQYTHGVSVAYIALSTLGLGLGFALLWTTTTTGAISALSKNFAGIASGTLLTLQEIGGNVGLAVAATAARYGTSFATGFHHGIWVMLILSAVGFLLAFFIPKSPKSLSQVS